MHKLSSNKHWTAAIFGVVCLVGAAAVLAQRQDGNSTPLASAQDLSTAFRNASKDAMGSVVAIETVSRAGMSNAPQIEELFKGSPFGEQFKDDPRFKRYFGQRGQRPMPRQHGRGSGFVVDPSGVIMTNSHVVRNAEKVTVRFRNGREYEATDIKFDSRSDIAILRIEADEPLQALPMGDSEEIQVGDWVLAIGSPFGLDMSVTAGIISAKGRSNGITERDYFLQTDAAINPGNSGGPLINLKGEVVGLNTAISTRSGGYDGVSFAIPVNMAKWVGGQLMANGKVQRAYLGIVIKPVDSDLADVLGTPVGEGAVVADVRSGTPAEKAELKNGDVIVRLNDQMVSSTPKLQRIVEELEIGKSYPIEVIRGGERVKLTMVAEAMPEDFLRKTNFQVDEPQPKPESKSFDDWGMEVQAITPEIAEQFGLGEDAGGVMVTDVKPDSPAAEKRMQPGTVIETVGKKFVPVSTPKEFAAAVEEHGTDKGVLLHIRHPNGRRDFVVLKK